MELNKQENFDISTLKSLLIKSFHKKLLKVKESKQSDNKKQKLVEELEKEFGIELDKLKIIEETEKKIKKGGKTENNLKNTIFEEFEKEIVESDNLIKNFEERINKCDLIFKKHFKKTYFEYKNEFEEKEANFVIPRFLEKILYDFQIEGVKFLTDNSNKILADEMGLGKTVQTITSLATDYLNTKNTQLSLILAPLTILNQWSSEIQKFFPFFRILIFHKNFPKIENLNKKVLKEIPTLILTSYESFSVNLNVLKEFDFNYLILDEGHKIKNFNTKIFGNVKKIFAKNKLILSGTPVQNNLKELWCLMNFINESVLGDFSSFNRIFDQKEIKHSEKKLDYLKNLINPFILRRTKLIATKSLPPKKEIVVLCPMTPYQKRIYEEESFKSYDNFKKYAEISLGFYSLHKLRKIANHPLSFVDRQMKDENSQMKDENNQIKEEESSSEINTEGITEKNLNVGKFAIMKKLIKKFIKDKRKTVVFSQSKKMIQLISLFLFKKEINHSIITGEVNINERKLILDNFQQENNIDVLIMTTRVGSLGLNLTAASRVIIYDPDWNPAVDNQAKNRVYRFGQLKDVETYTLISKNTVEEDIYERQILKNLLVSEILSENKKSSLLKEMENILRLKRNKKADKTFIVKEQKEEQKIDDSLHGKQCDLTAKELIDFIEFREKNFN